jgi:hypothetical protein
MIEMLYKKCIASVGQEFKSRGQESRGQESRGQESRGQESRGQVKSILYYCTRIKIIY